MLDFDLAAIYGYETKYFNRQVNNNLARFDEDFRFQLTEEEFTNLRCKNFTSSWGGKRYLPYAFTEEGIYMLMAVLKGDLAVSQSKKLIKLFKQMKDFIIDHGTPEEIIFHCGGSSKDGGKRITSISQVEDVILYQNIVSSLQGNPELQL